MDLFWLFLIKGLISILEMTNLKNEIALIVREMEIVRSIFQATVKLIPSFDITDSKVLPYGLWAHTRSIAWIVEQVITQ